MKLQNDKTLTSPRQRKAGIISIHRFAGIDAVCFYALSDLDRVVEQSEVLELGEFLNRYIANARAIRAECGSGFSDGLLIHEEAPIGWYSENFSLYARAQDQRSGTHDDD